MAPRTRKLLKWLIGSLASVVVLFGLLFAAFGVIVGRVPEYRVQLQDWINQRSGLVVEFKSLNARLRLYGPELVFNEAVVRTPDRTRVLATARRGRVAFDVWNSIRTGRLTAGRFALEAPQIGLIRTREGRIQLVGQSALPERPDAEPFAIEKLPTGHFHVERAVVSFRDEITGRGPWSLSGVSFDLYREPRSLQLRGDASLPKALGRKLEFQANVEGALGNSAELVSTFSVEGTDLDLSGWADVLPDAWPAPETGAGSIEVRGALHGATLVQLAAHADLANVATALPAWTMPLPTALQLEPPTADTGAAGAGSAAAADDDSETASQPQAESEAAPEQGQASEPVTDEDSVPLVPEVVSYERVAFDVRAQRVDDAWNLTISDLDLTRPESEWRAKRIEAKWSRDATGRIQASGKADRIVLDNLWPMFAYLPESESVAHLRALDASGTVADLSFELSRADATAAPHYEVQARLGDVGFQPVNRAPGLSGLSGRLHATEAGGEWQLASSNMRFDLPRMFRDTLQADTLEGKLEWHHSDAGWTIAGGPFNVASEDGTGVARLNLQLPADDSSPILDLSAEGRDLRVSSTHKYIPADKLGAKTMEWFDHAFVDGRVVSAAFVYKGAMRDFPFRKNEGTFFVRGHVEGATLDYQPQQWAPATQVVADVEFRNAGMHVHASAANVGNLQVTEASADIADLKKTRLVINAVANGTLRDGIELLKASPIGPKLGDQFAHLQGQGAIRAQLGLDLPIRNLDARKIDVTTQLTDGTVSLQGIDAPVSALQGTLSVHNTLLSSADLEGHWLGAPLNVTIRADGPDRSILDATGRVSGERLQPLLGLPQAVRLSGATGWHVSATLPAGGVEDVQRVVDIDSDLQGLGIGLPYPLGKSDDEPKPLRLSLRFDGDDALTARGSLGDVRSLMRLRSGQQGWELDRGAVRADAVVPALPDHRGIRIEGAVDHFVLDDWLALKGPQGGGKPLSYYLQAANVRVGTLEVLGYRWSDVRGMLQSTSAGWRVDVDGPGATGQIIIPESFTGAQPLRATLDKLQLDKAQQSGEDDGGASDPRNVPNLQVYVSDLHIGTRTIGALELKTSRAPQGLHIDNATIVGESVRAQVYGDWLMTTDGPRSSLQATITSSDVAQTLRALGYREVVQGKRGEVRADLTWPGAYDMDFLDHASGTIAVDAESGQLVIVQPGAGRVLGLFSVAALPRRLSLDFSDLTEKGLAFDTVHGDFELRDGNAYTSNLLLRGPAAEIGIVGRTGLGAKDYDQTAVVTGHLGVSLPVAGALAGGPVIGAAVLLFSQVFKEPLKGITRGYYRITGPWDDPVVERVDASGVKAEAATRGR
jgi:uncharacterized protein (TIGR02099 family)